MTRCGKCRGEAPLAQDGYHRCPACEPAKVPLAEAVAAAFRDVEVRRLALAACWLEPVRGGVRVWCPPAKGRHKPRVLGVDGAWHEHLPSRELFPDEDAAALGLAKAKGWWL